MNECYVPVYQCHELLFFRNMYITQCHTKNLQVKCARLTHQIWRICRVIAFATDNTIILIKAMIACCREGWPSIRQNDTILSWHFSCFSDKKLNISISQPRLSKTNEKTKTKIQKTFSWRIWKCFLQQRLTETSPL